MLLNSMKVLALSFFSASNVMIPTPFRIIIKVKNMAYIELKFFR